jgi:hypothetical protein
MRLGGPGHRRAQDQEDERTTEDGEQPYEQPGRRPTGSHGVMKPTGVEYHHGAWS